MKSSRMKVACAGRDNKLGTHCKRIFTATTTTVTTTIKKVSGKLKTVAGPLSIDQLHEIIIGLVA